MKPLQLLLATATLCLATYSCSGPQVPDQYADSGRLPDIYPDYRDVTIPVNIAPLAFSMDTTQVDEMVARFACGEQTLVCGGENISPDIDDWHRLLANVQGKDLNVDLYTRSGSQWTHHQPFAIHVSQDSIDPWLSYRLISPSYVTYEELTLNQRCLENFDERVMVDNMLCGDEENGQCVNCHNYQRQNPGRMQFHARQKDGGTVIVYDGTVRKINMSNDSILSAGVYPTWHPWLPLIVYSTNKTSQTFHTRNLNKIEVFDAASDLIAYDVARNEATNIERDSTEFECYPYWAPDGRTLYYCSAHFEFRDTIEHGTEVIKRAQEVKYNLYRKTFSPETMEFGPRQLVYAADTITSIRLGANADSTDTSGLSATLPRVSPDGRFLVFTLGKYGVFHIWHHEADLYIMDLRSGDVRPFTELNSDDTESYHTWSSTGRWMVFSSRRDDGGFTRPFIGHIDAQGHASKPFELPQADPEYHRQLMKSYNIPEFMLGPVEQTPQQFADVLKGSAGEKVKYVQRLTKK